MKRSLALRLTPSDTPARCPGYGGVCLHLLCRENLIVEITPSGSIHVPATPGRVDAVTLPAKRLKTGQSEVARLSRMLGSRRMDPVTNRVLARAHYLASGWGGVCLRWLERQRAGEMQRHEVAAVQGVTKQRVQQIEAAAMRKLRDGRAGHLEEEQPIFNK